MGNAMHSTKIYGALGWLFAPLILAGILIACGGPSTATPTPSTNKLSIPKVTLIVRDLSLNMPTTLHAGFVDITMVNEGTQTQPAQFARLKQGATLEQLQAAVQKERHAILPLIIPTGGMLSVRADHSQEIVLDLPEGQYVVFNFLPGDETLPGAGKALVTSFTVIGPSNTEQVRPPRSDIEVTMRDFSFDTPETLKPGLLTYQVMNRGAQAHEMVFLKLDGGKTWKDVMAFLQSPQSATLPGRIVGGMSALSPGETAWVTMDLVPGTYVVLCFLPDKTSEFLHVQLGMICSITVK
jgi:hypothetical protein